MDSVILQEGFFKFLQILFWKCNLQIGVYRCVGFDCDVSLYFSFSSERLLALTGSAYQKKRRQREKPRFLPLGTHFLSWWRTRCLCTALIAPEVTYTKSAELLPSVATNSVAQRTRETGRCSHQEKENCNFPFGESQIKISQPSSKPLPTTRLP
jgi:hypothetical protein